ncbi:MAG: putative sulfate exporter family transporter [Pseudomonadota bacterium]
MLVKMQISDPSETVKTWAERAPSQARAVFPGVLIAALVALSAQFLSQHYQTPAMLLALLLGIAVNFLGEDAKTANGVGFAARSLLRLGIACLGARISWDLVAALGGTQVALVVFAVLATIAFGFAFGHLLGHRWRFSLLTAGSVAICGASAAMAISAILPRDERSEERLIFTVIGVTVLSTVAMIAYPIAVQTFDLSDQAGGLFLGGTIHDVAQVVGAGFSINQDTGDTATLIKLIRVAMLAPVVLIASLLIRQFAAAEPGAARPPILPGFVLAFAVLATLNSFHLVPSQIQSLLGETSRWLLLTAIAAVGMKTNLKQVVGVGGLAITLICAETVFIAAFVLGGVLLLS